MPVSEICPHLKESNRLIHLKSLCSLFARREETSKVQGWAYSPKVMDVVFIHVFKRLLLCCAFTFCLLVLWGTRDAHLPAGCGDVFEVGHESKQLQALLLYVLMQLYYDVRERLGLMWCSLASEE